MASSKSHLTSGLLCAILLSSFPNTAAAQTANPEQLNALYKEAQTAFSAQDYGTAATKLEELIKGAAGIPAAPVELLRFSLGLAYLNNSKFAEAETAFKDCLKQFPQGEYASRCHLGIGKSILARKSDDPKAIDSLRIAANDPKYRTEAGLNLGKLYNVLDRQEEALTVFRSLMGTDIRTPAQTTAAVEVVGLFADQNKIEELVSYLNRLIRQPGVRDVIAWYSNQVISRADLLMQSKSYDAALVIYRSVPPRSQILSIQSSALAEQKKLLATLKTRAEAEDKLPLERRPKNSNTAELLSSLESSVKSTEEAMKLIEDKADLDAALLMRRGRALYYLSRYEEALICFRTIRNKYPTASDAQQAAYSEIVIFNAMKNTDEIEKLSADFIKKFPNAANGEQVGLLAGDGLAKAGKWNDVIRFYTDLEKKFPNSTFRDRFAFYQGVALFQLMDYPGAAKAFQNILQNFPNSDLTESVLYRLAMAHFLTNNYNETLAACQKYLLKFPEGEYAGEIRYRLAFIDFNDKEDKSDKIIRDLSAYLEAYPTDPAAGSMLSLLGDVWSQKKKNDDQALEAYKRVATTQSSLEVLNYAIQAATSIMQGRKDWAGLAAFHTEIYNRQPSSPLGLSSATWVAKMKVREGKPEEAADFLVQTLKGSISDPANEQVETLIDELAKTFVPPGKKARDANVEQLADQLAEVLKKAVGEQVNQTSNARIYYARAKLALLLKDSERSNRYLAGIATAETDPAALSPTLLAVSADILRKESQLEQSKIDQGKLNQAEAMYQRLADRYKDSFFSDAGPVGLGQIAFIRGNFKEALTIFDDILANNSGTSRYVEASLGKLKAMVALGQLDAAEKMAIEMMNDKKTFRGAPSAEALIQVGQIYRKRSVNLVGDAKKESLVKAHAYFQKTYVGYKAYPEQCAEGYWNAYEVAKEIGDETLANTTLRDLTTNPKLQKTKRSQDANKLLR